MTPNFIPTDSDDGKSDLAAGCSSGTKKILPMHEESSMNPFKKVDRLFERDSSVGSRYSVSLPNGIKIEELNHIDSKNMNPFDRVTFTDYFFSLTDVSYQEIKRAAKKWAKYYRITRQWQSKMVIIR
ncbi:YdgH/BhsA/McbA-like domain containing protein [Candidatus Williamhamiltonella defendens]|uniref:YdgH/BhsA/McbA-like domain containing protein n=1 Tax=Candidatus Williamhamiltonella defendens TaxID=138072 RepID=UPI001F2F125B|nr:YdgH/BhsA/McbA-like domain containing protein [Candidatus Hamiltonella defensa]